VKIEKVYDYLKKRGVNGDWKLTINCHEPLRLFRGGIIIPAFAEFESIPELIKSLNADSTLAENGLIVVFVLNNRIDALDSEKMSNVKTLKYLSANSGSFSFPVGIIDAFSPGLELPNKDGGVGLARKIGHDFLLPYFDFENCDPIMISLDADTIIEPGYAGAILDHFANSPDGGAVIPFRHRDGATEQETRYIRRYEQFLQSYVDGLKYAGSPYGFQTIGSAMACRASAYVASGGMNKRRAGEDFYFLQSLAKVTGIGEVKGTVVHPSPRCSDRVPFGTGRAMCNMYKNGEEAILFYDPRCYFILKAWLEIAEKVCKSMGPNLLEEAFSVSKFLAEFLIQQGFEKIWEKMLMQHKSPEQLGKAFHNWFDAFRTMKLVHYLSDTAFPRCTTAALCI